MLYNRFRNGVAILSVGGLLALALVAADIFTRSPIVAAPQADASILGIPATPDEKPAHNAPILRSTVRSTFTVLNHPDINDHHRTLVEDALRSLPSGCRWALKNLYVRTDDSVERALGGSETIILNGNVPNEEFRALFIHEFGHITDLGCLTGTLESGASMFHDGPDVMWKNDQSVGFYRISWVSERIQKKGSAPEDFVSGYASWDAFEDFAETFTYYVLQRDAFRKRAKTNVAIAAKLAWMEAHVFTGYAPPATGTSVWKGDVPWDVTLLPYTWKPVVVAEGR